jgi:asparagine synthase (glutamine-hydrolysing)
VEGMNRNHYLLPELLQKPEYNFLIEAEQSLDPFRWSLYDAFHRRILPNVLRVFDRATMAASLESRMPFMDYRIVQYVFSLPISDIVNNGETKHILRQAVKNILPDTIINRKAKMGFAVSLKQWFNDPKVYNYLSEIVHDSSFYDHNFINKNKFILEFDRALEQGFSWQDTIRVWEVVNLSLWWQIFVKKNVNY